MILAGVASFTGDGVAALLRPLRALLGLVARFGGVSALLSLINWEPNQESWRSIILSVQWLTGNVGHTHGQPPLWYTIITINFLNKHAFCMRHTIRLRMLHGLYKSWDVLLPSVSRPSPNTMQFLGGCMWTAIFTCSFNDASDYKNVAQESIQINSKIIYRLRSCFLSPKNNQLNNTVHCTEFCVRTQIQILKSLVTQSRCGYWGVSDSDTALSSRPLGYN